MSNLSLRGTKRICQSETCALPFYDLNRADISCPSCGTVFDTKVAIHPRKAPASTPSWKRGSRAFQGAVAAPAAKPMEQEDEVEVEVEADADDAVDADAGALILEEDEDEEVGDVIKPPADDRDV